MRSHTVRYRMFVSFLFCVSSTIVSLASSQEGMSASTEESAAQSESTDFEIPFALTPVRIPSLGDISVAVYANKDKDKFYYQPLLLPDWPAFDEALTAVGCRTTSEGEAVHTVQLFVEHGRVGIEQEIVNGLIQQPEGASATLAILSIIPHTYFQISVNFGPGFSNKDVLISTEEVPTQASGVSRQTVSNIRNKATYEITGSCAELSALYNRRGVENSVKGRLFGNGFAYSADFVSAALTITNTDALKAKLFGKESQEYRVVTKSKSSGGGMSLNLPGVSLGGGGTSASGSVTTSNQRILSRDFLVDFVSYNSFVLELEVVGDPARTQATVVKFVDALLSQMKEVRLAVDTTSNEQWKLLDGQVEYATLNKTEIEEFLKTAPEQTVTGSSEQSASADGATATTKNSSDFSYKDGIEWKRTGTGWIPTNVDLYVAIETDITNEYKLTGAFINVGGRRAMVNNFVYPATYWKDQGDLEPTLTETIMQIQAELRLPNRCRVQDAPSWSPHSSWPAASKATCNADEILTGGACKVAKNSMATSSQISVENGLQVYSCIVSGPGSVADVLAQAICCK